MPHEDARLSARAGAERDDPGIVGSPAGWTPFSTSRQQERHRVTFQQINTAQRRIEPQLLGRSLYPQAIRSLSKAEVGGEALGQLGDGLLGVATDEYVVGGG
jgi:hypothetical protein